MKRRNRILIWIASAVALAAILLGAAHLAGAAVFRGEVAAMRERLGVTDPDRPVDTGVLPSVARDFARRATGVAAEPPRTVTLVQRAEMRLEPDGPWLPVAATQTLSVAEPGFLWLARARLAPGISTHVVDAYIGGEGRLTARLFGSLPVADASGPDMARGELMRYLAEIGWVPHAILYNRGLTWRTLEDGWVELSAGEGATQARVRLRFDEAGDVVETFAADRPRDVGGQTVPTPWRGRFSDYRTIGGLRIPTRAEVSWELDAGPFVYWRGEIADIRADY